MSMNPDVRVGTYLHTAHYSVQGLLTKGNTNKGPSYTPIWCANGPTLICMDNGAGRNWEVGGFFLHSYMNCLVTG